MWNRPIDSEPDDDLFAEEFGASLAAIRKPDCPDPRRLTALEEGVLPQDEAAIVRVHLERCACCRQLASHMAALPDTDAAPGARERILARIRSAAMPARPERRRFDAHTLWRWALVPVAASAVLLFAVIGRRAEVPSAAAPPAEESGARPAPAQLAALIPLEQAPIELPLEALLTSRAEPDVYYSTLVEALVPYKEGRYGEASLKLDVVAARHPDRAEAHFYLGVSHLMRGNAADAIPRLETAERLSEGAFRQMAGWYLAQAYLHASNAEAAAGRLRALCAAAGGYQAHACAAAERLDEPRKK